MNAQKSTYYTRHRVKFLLCMIVFISWACVPAYKSPDTGSLAQVTFSAPNLPYAFGFTDLDLYINYADDYCQLIKLGKVELSPGHKEEKFKLEVGKRAYLKVDYFVNGVGFSSKAEMLFSFVPELGSEYNIQYMHFSEHMEVNLFKKSSSGEMVRIDMDKYGSCQSK